MTDDAARRRSVFIAYAHADRATAELVTDRLKSVGMSVGTAGGGRGGEVWRNLIEQSLRTSDYFIPLISQTSVSSGFFAEEFFKASFVQELSDRAISIIPIVLNRAEVPAALRGVLYLDFTADPLSALARLVATVAPAVKIDFASLGPWEFERLVADLIADAGRDAIPDVRIDGREYDFLVLPSEGELFARRNGGSWIIEVKHRSSDRASAAMIGRLVGDTAALRDSGHLVALVTSSQLTSAAREVARMADVHVVEGVDLERLLVRRPDLIQKYFGQRHLK